MKIRFFDEKIEKFILSLEKETIAKVLRMIDFLERFGNILGMPHSKKVHSNLFELRARGAQEVRIFYSFFRDEAVLLHGFLKKSNRIPGKELSVALYKLKCLAEQ